ncbi:MAG: hypothetical protein HOI23_10400 [Deltaproteobacteria bacterium]|jgi:hypothetical protein|nr:hypothetical protein [Deltaproteobacteria bacterium]MBT6433350.1 hypothetical protein [Deltaproteobacteria bacterium]MBT6490019.1 hypothetical protein [Deltaproteobacteria bacterium]
MSRISSDNNAGLRVQIDSSRSRQTSRTSFGDVLSTGLSKSANTVMNAGNMAAPFIPGGAVLSAAITGLGSLKSAQSGGSAAPNSTGLSAGSGSVVGGGSQGVSGGSGTMDSVASLAAGGSEGAIMMQATREMQEMNQQFNLQYLNLQQDMQQENRKFTAISNVMKTKHDTAKGMIQNVR